MKRTLVALMLVVALTAPAFGQFVPSSLENILTGGTSLNEIDQSFQANVDFGTFKQDFIFAGLGNPIEMAADTTITFSAASPFTLGYAMAGDLPISLYTTMYYAPIAAGGRKILADYTVNSYTGKIVTSGTTTTTHRWLDTATASSPTESIYLSSYTAALQGLTKLGPAIFGLYLNLSADNTAADATGDEVFFLSSTATHYYDTAIVGIAPIPAQDYTVTESATNINILVPPAVGGSGLYSVTDTIRFAIPFAMRTGALEHMAYVDTSIKSTDASAAYSIVESAHVVAAATATDETLTITDKQNTTDIKLYYSLGIPTGNLGDKWFASTSFNLGLNGSSYSYDSMSRDYDLSVAAVKTELAGGTHTAYSKTFEPSTDIIATLEGGRLFIFKPTSAIMFKLAPSLNLTLDSLSNGGAAIQTGYTTYSQTLNASGVYDVTTNYSNTAVSYTGERAKKLDITAIVELPMGLVVKPEGWKFNLILGAIPQVKLVSSTSTATSMVTTTTTTNYTADAITGITVNTANPTNPGQMTTTLTPTLSETHYLGISVPFDGGVRFDIHMNASLLNFESFTIQAFIPLGAK